MNMKPKDLHDVEQENQTSAKTTGDKNIANDAAPTEVDDSYQNWFEKGTNIFK